MILTHDIQLPITVSKIEDRKSLHRVVVFLFLFFYVLRSVCVRVRSRVCVCVCVQYIYFLNKNILVTPPSGGQGRRKRSETRNHDAHTESFFTFYDLMTLLRYVFMKQNTTECHFYVKKT